jgi:hypothetical protein
MNTRPRFVITFTPGPDVDAIRSLRLLLKAAKRRFGLMATDAYEDKSSPLEISNQAADEFKELRDAIIEERAQKWSAHGDEHHHHVLHLRWQTVRRLCSS